MKSDITFIVPVISGNFESLASGIPKSTEQIFFGKDGNGLPANLQFVKTENANDTEFISDIFSVIKTPFAVFIRKPVKISISENALLQLIAPLKDSDAILTYCDFFSGTEKQKIETIDYQEGSVRDDFDFGPVVAFAVSKVQAALKASGILKQQKLSAFYALHLSVALTKFPKHLPKPLYTVEPETVSEEYEAQFNYVDPKNRAVQIELEETFNLYAQKARFHLPPSTRTTDFTNTNFKAEASVIIPVRNRENTIVDAITSALSQKTKNNFNVIVVDNHSTDKTTERIALLQKEHKNLIHVIPEENDLLIGGCWNKAISHPEVGRFSIQLDSDDLYIDQYTVQKVVDCFHAESCGAVVGSYKLVNFDLKEIPPGLIDHREWTPNNGHNNALRINGLGAPRAFYTPIARAIKFENVSYGEDYAMMLAVCREHKIGRIYEPLYLCRRWDGNSDANLPQDKINKNNTYKDLIRTREIIARKKLISEKR